MSTTGVRAMQVRVLGPIGAELDQPAALGGPTQRRVLAVLALHAGSAVSVDRLVDAVWPDGDAPDRADHNVRTYVHRLRSALGDDGGRVETVGNGYRLVLGREELDATRFEDLVGAGREAAARDDHDAARRCFDEALALWAGRPYDEFADEEWARAEVARLDELRASAVEHRNAALLDAGRHTQAIGELRDAASEQPWREVRRMQLSLALYRSGRQAEALQVVQDYRAELVEGLGLDPSPELGRLEHQILDHDPELMPPSHRRHALRGYQLDEVIGEGAFALVWRGVQPSLGRTVAVKQIRAELANRPDFVRRFETEAQTVAMLEHPYIVPLYDYWREPDGAYLVMRYVAGGSLESEVLQGGLDEARLRRFVDQAGSALEAAHRMGVIHRDVKAANVLLDDAGNFYLTDFGIAFVGSTADDELATSLSTGSPAYASPEQLRRQSLDVRTDIYGFGITLFEAATGRLPFADAPTEAALVRRQLDEPVPAPSSVEPSVPPWVDEVVARATAKNPADRYGSMAELMAAILPAAGQPADAGRPLGTATVIGELVNPFKALRAFREADAADFYGRDRLITRFVDVLSQPGSAGRLLAVVGPSGSGKSSVVRSGLVPRLRQGAVTGSADWFITTMIPGNHPFDELESALSRVAVRQPGPLVEIMRSDERGIARAVNQILPDETSELLVVIDQFEELFTHGDTDETRAFVDGLVAALREPRARLRVVLTIRADFWDRPLRHPALAARLESAAVTVSPLATDELEAAIVEPVRRQGATYEPGLVARIMADVRDQPGALPLLQYALTELFDTNVSGLLQTEAYDEIGGLTGALAQRAEQTYADLTEDQQAAARRLFRRLVTPGEGTEDTRRRVRVDELGTDADTRAVVDAFGDARLLVFDHDPMTREPTVELAHEALIRAWARLRRWIDDDRQGLRVLRHLTASAKAWIDTGRDPGELYRGGRLVTALDWAADHAPELATDEREFLDASRTLRDAERNEQTERIALRERQHRRLRRTLVGLAGVLVLALAASGVALQQRSAASDRAADAADARAAAETRRLVADAVQLAPTDRRVALLLAAEAHRRQPDAASLGALKDVLASSTDVLGYVGADIEFADVAWTDDGRIVGTHADGVTVLTTEGRHDLDIDFTGADELAVRPDGRVAAVAGSDGTVRIFDLATGDQAAAPLVHGSPVTAVAFSGDGGLLVTGDREGVVRVFDERFGLVDSDDEFDDAGQLPVNDDVDPPLSHDPNVWIEGVMDVAASSDGRFVAAVGNSEFVMWDRGSAANDPRRADVTRSQGSATRAAVPTGVAFVEVDDEERLVVTEVYSASIHDLATLEQLDRWMLSDPVVQFGYTVSVAFGNELVAISLDDGKVRLAGADGELAVFDSQFATLSGLAVEPGGTRAVGAGREGAVVFSLVGEGLISRSAPGLDRQELSVSNDGRSVIAASVGRQGSQWWTLDGEHYRERPTPALAGNYAWTGMPYAASYDLESRTFQLHDTATMEPSGPEFGPNLAVTHSVSPDGQLLVLGSDLAGRRAASGAGAGVVDANVYDVASGEHIARLDDFATETTGLVRSLKFSPDGRRLLVATDDGRAVFYDTATWERGQELSAGGGAVVLAAYSGTGEILATVSADGTITFRDPQTLQPDGPLLLGNTDSVEGGSSGGPSFSDDDRWMVTTADGDLRLYDVQERALVGGRFPSRGGSSTAGASRNARFGVTRLDDRAIVWTIEPERWPEIACQAAGRNMTPDEWAQYGPSGEPYRATCDQWPSLSDQPDGGKS